MSRVLTVAAESFPIDGTFTIYRGSRTESEVLTCTIAAGARSGRGECVPYRRYGETMACVRGEMEAMAAAVAAGITRQDLLTHMKAGAARNAIDCALWDLEAKTAGRPVWTKVCAAAPRALTTAFTLSLGTPETMAAQALSNAHRPLLKIKLGAEGDIDRMRAVRAAAPKSRIIIDANEGWTEEDIDQNMAAAADLNVALVEQPLPAGRDDPLRRVPRRVPVCADESVHVAADLDSLVGRYDAVNVKLDKTGGLTAALLLRDRARALGFSVMVGCMVGTSLAMAPAVLLAQDADFVDLDGPLLLAQDRDPGLLYRGSLVSPPDPALWG